MTHLMPMTLSLFLALYFSSGEGLQVCSRKRYVFTSTAVFQRVHLPTPERCVERCVENMSFCKAAVYTPHKDKFMGVCTLFSENSIQQPTALHPDASVEPVSTVHEILERCPLFSLPEITYRISSNHRRKLEYDGSTSRASDESIRTDVFLRDREQFVEQKYRASPDRYATMTPLSLPNSARKYADSRDQNRPKSPFEGVPAIVPVAVLHMGQAVKAAYDICGPGAMCVPTLASMDSSPCPARQGDPCAPKSLCPNAYPTTCAHSEPQVVPSVWAEWGLCSQTCGAGTRTRQCSGVGCLGPAVESCSMIAICQEWSQWNTWTACSATCGEGERKRTRECIGGRDCPGVSMTVETCAAPPCPSWTDWSPWEGCSITCGTGQERRSRTCQNGLFCPGPNEEIRTCDRGHCARWAGWTSWTACTRSCDTGETYRTRKCEHGSCEGASEERLLCNQQECPSWTEWTAWTVCANKCDEDTYRIRSRICMSGGVAHAGCEGPAQDQSACPTKACPTWSDWGEWSECSTTCGQGNQARTRTCDTGTDCAGSNREIRFCQLASCPYWDEWMDWGGCSVTCGIGVCERRRRCITDDLLNLPNLDELDETLFEMESDRAKSALIARSRSGIRNFVYRNYTTEDAVERTRRTPSRATIEGGGTCIGSNVDRKPCDAGPCCSWESWSEWSPCIGCGSQSISRRSRLCRMDDADAVFSPLAHHVGGYRGAEVIGDGFQPSLLSDSYRSPFRSSGPLGAYRPMAAIVPVNHRKQRQIAVFPPRGMQCCTGAAFETRPCRVECEVPRPCEWSEWGEWCGCTRCRGGKEVRRRFCDRGSSQGAPSLPDSSCNCLGQDTDTRNCAVEKDCDKHRTPNDGGVSQDYGGQQVDDRRSQAGGYVPIRARVEDEQHERLVNFQPLDKRDSALSTTTSPYSSCRWSRWSEWSQCIESSVRQRNRFCIGNDVLVSDCECMGYTAEEEPCDFLRSTTTGVMNEVQIPSIKSGSDAVFSADDEKKLEEDIQKALKPGGALRASQDEVSLSSAVANTEKCEWTRWSQWSMCTVSCGTGERVRKRRCTCGDLRCGGGSGQETSKCSEWKCDRRMPPIFNID